MLTQQYEARLRKCGNWGLGNANERRARARSDRVGREGGAGARAGNKRHASVALGIDAKDGLGAVLYCTGSK